MRVRGTLCHIQPEIQLGGCVTFKKSKYFQRQRQNIFIIKVNLKKYKHYSKGIHKKLGVNNQCSL